MTSSRNRALCAAFVDWHGKRNKALSTYQYAATLEKFCQLAGSRQLGALTVEDIEGWLYRPNERRGGIRADSTIARERVIVSCLYDWAVTRGHLHRNPAAESARITVRNHHPKAIDTDLWIKLWTDDSLRDAERVVLGLGFFCGLRREELCRLQGEHFVENRIVGFPRKGDRSDKTTGIMPYVSCIKLFDERAPELGARRLCEPLDKLLAVANPYVIPWGEERRSRRGQRPGPPKGMTDPDAVNRHLKRICERLGLDAALLTPHCLRHSFVTNLLRMGIPILAVSQLANHSSVTITQRYNKAVEDPLAEFLGKGPMDGRTPWGTF